MEIIFFKFTRMNYSSKYLFGIGVLILLFSSCLSRREHTIRHEIKSESEKPSEFVSNPQDVPEREIVSLSINSIAPDFNLPGVDGNFYTLDDFSDADVLVVIFTCNHCPTAQAYENRIIKLVNDYKNQSVRVVAISPNSVKSLLLEELGYSDLGDSFEEMKIRARNKNFNFVYLYDGDNQETSIKYGPMATPHAFVFNKERKLKYRGRLDDDEKRETAQASDLRAAMDAVLFDVEILEPIKKSFGCSVKWAWKNKWTKKVNDDWGKMPVTLNEISTNGVRMLMNNHSERLRLINVWATWCGPCTIEYPEFIDIHRMYIGRDFEFISISADKLSEKAEALKFLQEKNSAVRNYIYNGGNVYDLLKAIDPDWDGAMPYTVLLEPEGKVVYKKMGEIEPLELKKTIVNHPMIGRYY